jgi:hypothetical protein
MRSAKHHFLTTWMYHRGISGFTRGLNPCYKLIVIQALVVIVVERITAGINPHSNEIYCHMSTKCMEEGIPQSHMTQSDQSYYCCVLNIDENACSSWQCVWPKYALTHKHCLFNKTITHISYIYTIYKKWQTCIYLFHAYIFNNCNPWWVSLVIPFTPNSWFWYIPFCIWKSPMSDIRCVYFKRYIHVCMYVCMWVCVTVCVCDTKHW